ncbi:MAG: efflux RND transporter periplasmic adaptor subunit, partial [Pseudomonadota bacterium]
MSEGPSEAKTGSGIGLLIKRLVFLALPVAVLVLGGVGFVAMGAFKPEPEEKAETIEALPVLTAEAFSEPVQLKVRSQGAVTARAEVSLASQISGRLRYVAPDFLPGGQFSRGDVLFRLEDQEYKLRVIQAEANVAQARTTFIRETSESRQASADAAELGVDAVSDLALRRPQMAEAEAMLASAEAALEEAKLQLNRAIIRAPFDGRVRTKLADIGAFVTPGMQLG